VRFLVDRAGHGERDFIVRSGNRRRRQARHRRRPRGRAVPGSIQKQPFHSQF
jgi:hypothetical protein